MKLKTGFGAFYIIEPGNKRAHATAPGAGMGQATPVLVQKMYNK